MIEVKIPSSGGPQSVGFSMGKNCDLTGLGLSVECDWLTVSSTTQGTSAGTITVSAGTYKESSSRKCYITPSYDGKVCGKNVFAVIQDGGGGPTPPTPTVCTCDNANLSVTGETVSSDGGNPIVVANFNTQCTGNNFTVVKKQGNDFITDFTFDFTAKTIKAKVSELTDTSSGRSCDFYVAIDGSGCTEFTVVQNPPICDCSTLMITPTTISWDSEGEVEIARYEPSACNNNLRIEWYSGDITYSRYENGVIYGNVTKNLLEDPSYSSFNVFLKDDTECEPFTVTQLGKTNCSCSYISSRIVYTQRYLPYYGTNGQEIMLFSADTMGCGSITGFCSSDLSNGILVGDGENLVTTKEIGTNQYAVYGIVNPYDAEAAGGGVRDCDVNVKITLEASGQEPVVCDEAVMLLSQDPNINCDRYDDGVTKIGIASSGGDNYRLVKTGSDFRVDVSKVVLVIKSLSENIDWIDRSSIRYQHDSHDFYIYGNVDEYDGTVDERKGTAIIQNIILNKEIEKNRKYTYDELMALAISYCEEREVRVYQVPCNCASAWIGGRSKSSSVGYKESTVQITTLNENINFRCVKIGDLSINDPTGMIIEAKVINEGTAIEYTVSENEDTKKREAEIIVPVVDANGNVCPDTLSLKISQNAVPIDCNDCDSIKSAAGTKYHNFWESKQEVLTLGCDVTPNAVSPVVIDFNGIDESVTANVLTEGDSYKYEISSNGRVVSVWVGNNFDDVYKYYNLTYNFTLSDSTPCSVTKKITQNAKNCTHASYSLEMVYKDGKGAETSNPYIVNENVKDEVVGYIKNEIGDLFKDCIDIKATCTQTTVVDNPRIVESEDKTKGFYQVVINTLGVAKDEVVAISINCTYSDDKPSSSVIHVKVIKAE